MILFTLITSLCSAPIQPILLIDALIFIVVSVLRLQIIPYPILLGVSILLPVTRSQKMALHFRKAKLFYRSKSSKPINII